MSTKKEQPKSDATANALMGMAKSAASNAAPVAKTAAPAKAAKAVKAPPVPKPEVPFFTPEHNKDLNVFQIRNQAGKVIPETELNGLRQIMMKLAYEKKQVLYFKEKKWRRKYPNGKPAKASPAPSVTAKPSAPKAALNPADKKSTAPVVAATA